MSGEKITTLIDPAEFFREKVREATVKTGISIDSDTDFYLVNLMSDFVAPHASGVVTKEHHNILDVPLALLLKQALEAPADQKIPIYKSLGDISLYMSGFFQDYFNNKTYDAKYFIALGSHAYSNIACLLRGKSKKKHFCDLYKDLAENFRHLVKILAVISQSLHVDNRPQSMISLYERWLNEPSEGLEDQLKALGVTPVFIKK